MILPKHCHSNKAYVFYKEITQYFVCKSFHCKHVSTTLHMKEHSSVEIVFCCSKKYYNRKQTFVVAIIYTPECLFCAVQL